MKGIDKKIKSRVLEKYDGKCAYCGIDLTNETFTVDHIVPKRRKMENVIHGVCHIDNYNPCCLSCNCSKSTWELEEWRDRLKNKLHFLNNKVSMYSIVKGFGLVKEVNIKKHKVVFYFEKIHNQL